MFNDMILHRLTVLLTFLFLSFEVDVLAYDLQRLFINVEGGNLSIVNAWDIDDSGVIVGFFFQSPSGSHGFIYDL